jgi:hypothetical protein
VRVCGMGLGLGGASSLMFLSRRPFLHELQLRGQDPNPIQRRGRMPVRLLRASSSTAACVRPSG